MLNLSKELENAKTIGISGHIRPDGDCIGSTMALYLYLKKNKPDANIRIFLEKPAEIFSCIKDIECVEDARECNDEFDFFFCLDCSKDRLGDAEHLFDTAKKTVNIDHHRTNAGCGDFNYINADASSASELVYELLNTEKLDKDIAEALYIGIIHDTGVFQYSNTSPHTLNIASELISYGFNFPRLIEETFYQKTYLQTQILGRALLESIMVMDGKVAVSVIDLKMMDFYGVTPQDLEGIVNQLRNIKGVDVAIFLYQLRTLEYKVSLRSNENVDVSKVCAYFGGGGHMRAAGCTLMGTSHDIVNNLTREIEKQYKNS